ncbi:hypothetical protein AVEN_271941-1 [Araneus ventricosus]|uniref:Uncharacterized protein n=1 Tax=Araneus ventricosus TaxID=182803 RepID=A0A4Y2CBT6_ARAVE|nr:hypothetical protein AVEN_271941-1 [Araneus ventricosus]
MSHDSQQLIANHSIHNNSNFAASSKLCIIFGHQPNILPIVWCGSFERGVPVQVLSSSSDSSSKLRGQSQNSPRVASNQDVNITPVAEIGSERCRFILNEACRLI